MAEQGSALTPVAPARTALVTGASRGIGRAVALGLADAGLDLALLARDSERLEEVATEVRGRGRRALVLPVDVTDVSAVRGAAARAGAELAGIDLLVNNAGRVDAEVPLWEADPEQWWAVVETNLRGPFLLSRAFVPAMISRGGGRVVELASGASTHDMTGTSAYNASKTAVLRLVANLHVSGFDRGLRAFGVAPGVVATDMTASMRMHANRTEWTPVERTVDVVTAIARGELDACSGWYIRVTDDTPASLSELAAASGPTSRRLRVLPANADDRLAADLTRR